MRARTRPTIVMLVSILIGLAVNGVSAQTQPDPASGAGVDAALSGVYVDQAGAAAATNDWQTVSRLLGVALEFNPKNSDALYLKGRAALASPTDISGAISSFSAALADDDWTTYDAATCRTALAPLLIRTMQYGRALSVLQSLTSDTADYLYEYAEAQAGLSRDVQARYLLIQAQQSFPDDARLAALRVQIDPTYRREIAQRFLDNPDAAGLDPVVLQQVIRFSMSDVPHLASLYSTRFPHSAVVFAAGLIASSSPTTGDIDTFVSDGSLSDGLLVQALYKALPSEALKTYLLGKLSAWTGTMTVDRNHDGWPEETATYSNGTLSEVQLDANQDGTPDVDVTFQSGKPTAVTLNEDAMKLTMTYSEYPFIAKAIATDVAGVTTYNLEPQRVSVAVLGPGNGTSKGIAAYPPEVSGSISITKSRLFAFASEVSLSAAQSVHADTVWHKSIDDIMHMVSDWENGSYSYHAVYHDGVIFSAERDIDGDGYFEVRERYRDGKLASISYDGDRNGIPEFTLTVLPYPVLSWDFNQDGVADAIIERPAAGKTVRMFSSKMNGVFDIVSTENNQ